MQILRIDSATTGDNSVTHELTDAIAEHFRGKYPDATWVVRDFATDPLPHLDVVTTGAIRQPQDAHTDAMKAAFPAERAVLDEFLASDIVILGVPMYNFTVPSSIKAWLDRLGVPGVTFGYTEKGPTGFAGGRRVIVASSRGGSYEMGGPAEHQETYLKTFFGFIGIDDVEFVRAEKIGFGPEVRAAAIAAAREEIAKL
ncbi:FMN-dependent NADH-azoreductase [Altererythrobacter salegens]|uniref:FMN dependent NADH:quinone oxidoreductase n=1 Tax=Croceibacterium salegens TaxID=1737568 RepID=A0A6I4SY13_9SPHN|nr:NAD(P)H-dependent oxidoreductase [Croceibacterium salegens]MXO59212.1 FMN-dependent NADH-azoreductase [Croceibacterium salegens]